MSAGLCYRETGLLLQASDLRLAQQLGSLVQCEQCRAVQRSSELECMDNVSLSDLWHIAAVMPSKHAWYRDVCLTLDRLCGSRALR
jgi:hypothetical protein